MDSDEDFAAVDAARRDVYRAWLADESETVRGLLPLATLNEAAAARVAARARVLVEAVRTRRLAGGGLDAFMHEYDLSSQEGVVLMCLAESLLRIPDADTADRLIQDKLAHADWRRHLGPGHSLLVNAGTWGLMLTGRIVRLETKIRHDPLTFLGHLVARSGEPVIRMALRQAMRIIAHQFVMGRDMGEALERARREGERDGKGGRWRYSFDMLGEAALCQADADRYCQAYAEAIAALAGSHDAKDVFAAPGVSVKLSALHPRFEPLQRDRLLRELGPRLLMLACRARDAGIGLTIDAEEAEHLDVTLDLFDFVYAHPSLGDWEGFGLAVQAYQKRALPVIEWLAERVGKVGRRIPLRLVKGAYWDSEIKRAQEQGLSGYPVFTRKAATDVSYLACARRLLEQEQVFYPQFATHNAQTVASLLEMAGPERVKRGRHFEFQRLHGMGEALYEALRALPEGRHVPCRVYAPVGGYEELLPYLVRRLLENGANTSFVNRIVDERVPVEEVVMDPVVRIRSLGEGIAHPRIPLPGDLYLPQRRNALGINLADRETLTSLIDEIEAAVAMPGHARPLVDGDACSGVLREIRDPAAPARLVGSVEEADEALATRAVSAARQAFPAWCAGPVEERAACLERVADLLEARRAAFMALVVREGGRTLPDALAELREAVDFCRYYAALARQQGVSLRLPGPVGERNTLTLRGRGVFACISPWNFPLAIFTGQVAAALVAGNCVIAKPASQTPLVASLVVSLFHEAGVPPGVLHFLPGDGEAVGMSLVRHPLLAGVAFTGSTATAWRINRALAARQAPIAALIAETGGQNAMIVDSSALPEQVVSDVLRSAFNSAGQRCSALRILYLQKEIAPRVMRLLEGAMAELRLGDPLQPSTDVGPLIDRPARDRIRTHLARMEHAGRLFAVAPSPSRDDDGDDAGGWFLAPRAYEIETLDCLQEEVFGPVLHVVRYDADHLDAVVDAVNATGYALTLGIHSRIEATAERIIARARAGNVYVNRNMIGAVVGVQPFGGEGLSGTGPKAGGPHYLLRFASEQTCTFNTAAVGGDPTLLSLADEDGDRESCQ